MALLDFFGAPLRKWTGEHKAIPSAEQATEPPESDDPRQRILAFAKFCDRAVKQSLPFPARRAMIEAEAARIGFRLHAGVWATVEQWRVQQERRVREKAKRRAYLNGIRRRKYQLAALR